MKLFPMFVNVIGAIAIANWFIYGALVISIGGSALCGEISGGEYLICRHAMSSGALAVSRDYWAFSLLYGFVTIGLMPLALALVFVSQRPGWAGGVFDAVAICFGVLWFLAIAAKAVPRWLAWVAA